MCTCIFVEGLSPEVLEELKEQFGLAEDEVTTRDFRSVLGLEVPDECGDGVVVWLRGREGVNFPFDEETSANGDGEEDSEKESHVEKTRVRYSGIY